MTFDFRPVLTSTLLTLRPLQTKDFNDLFAVAGDPLMWAQHPDKERYKEPVFRMFFDEAVASDSALITLDNETKSIIGTSRYHGYDPSRSEIEIGWTFLARSYWGGKYNKEMKRLMLEHAYRYVSAVLFIIGSDNLRSRKAAMKLGASLDDDNLIRGGLRNAVYKLSRDQYNESPIKQCE